MNDFEDLWVDIHGSLHAGDEVKNWGAARGFTGGSFKIECVDKARIIVSGGAMTGLRNVLKGDFAKVYAVWDQYFEGNYPRAKLTGLSQNTTYILSILHRVMAARPT